MKLYLAGLFACGFALNKFGDQLTEVEERDRSSVRNLLDSYHYVHRQRHVDNMRRENKKIFLDSGAFSAFTSGIKIDLEGYCRYIHENIDVIECIDGNVCASVLDSIGSAQGTYNNQMRMEKLGVRPLPCFHYGEDERWLSWYVANYDHITLGGMVPISTPQLKIWLDRIWDKYLTDGAGRPKLKVHGFGLTSLQLMSRYPWYSCDSSSWVQGAAMGGILFQGTWKVLAISSLSPARKNHNQHFNTLPDIQQQSILDNLEQSGYTIDRLQNNYLSRWSYNAGSYTRLEDEVNRINNGTFQVTQLGLF